MKKIKYLMILLPLFLSLCSCAENHNTQVQEGTMDAPIKSDIPVKDDADLVTETQENVATELKEFNIYDIQFTIEDFPNAEFLSEEQERTFMLATFVYMTLDLDGDMFFRYNNIRPLYNSEVRMCHTGFTYESVMNGFNSVLSENILSEKFKERYSELNGEFLCLDGARGASADFDCIKGVTPVEITDDKVSFQLTAAYADPGTKESLGETAFDFEMLLTDGHWVMTKYELWF